MSSVSGARYKHKELPRFELAGTLRHIETKKQDSAQYE